MNTIFITSVSEIREQRKFNIEDRINELKLNKAMRASANNSNSSGGGSRFMKGGQETEDFMIARENFKIYLSKVMTEKAAANGDAVQAVGVFINTGREFDKVMVASFKTITDRSKKMEVSFFIHKKTGAIFGAKSSISPNMKHFYGTLWTTDKWDWTGVRPAPMNKDVEAAGVVEEGFYKPYIHYIPTNPELYKNIYGKELELPIDKIAVV